MQDEILNCFRAVFSDAESRGNATDQMKAWAAGCENHDGVQYLFCLFDIVGGNSGVDNETMSQAAVEIKNIFKNGWKHKSSEHPVFHDARPSIRENLFPVMMNTSSNHVRKVIQEAIRLVAEEDYPTDWPQVLELCKDALMTDNLQQMLCALSTSHGVFERYRMDTDLDPVLIKELTRINAILTVPLLETMESGLKMLDPKGPNQEEIMEILTLALETMLDIVWIDMGEEHEQTMDRHMNVLLAVLEHQDQQHMGNQYEVGKLMELKTTAMTVLSHLLQNFGEDMEDYISVFTNRVWEMLKEAGNDESFGGSSADTLLIGAMEFLATISQGSYKSLLGSDETLQTLCREVILPCLTLTEDDIEQFSDEPKDYVVRDIEGSDHHTRRRSAYELVSALMVPFEETVGSILFENAQELIERSSRGDWKGKDTAIYLVTALAIKGFANAHRGTSTTQLNGKVPINEFYENQVLPELQRAEVAEGSHAIIKADAIRFITVFRKHLPVDHYPMLIECLTVFLDSESYVVHSYAAHAIERLLLVEDEGAPRLHDDNLGNAIPGLLANLCIRLGKDRVPNPYVPQALMRSLMQAPRCSHQFVGDILGALAPVLAESAKNPSNPLFSYALFESISQCINIVPEAIADIEALLWDILVGVLQNDILEFVPYALQLIGQMLDAHPPDEAIPEQYKPLVDPLLKPVMYEQKGNIPAVVRCLNALVRRGARELEEAGIVDRLIGVFQYLVSMRLHDHEGIRLAITLVLHCPDDLTDRYIEVIVKTLLERYKAAKTPKFVRHFDTFIGYLAARRGGQYVIDVFQGIQQGLVLKMLGNVFLPNVNKLSGDGVRKAVVIAIASLVNESTLHEIDTKLWVDAVYTGCVLCHGNMEMDDALAHMPRQASVQDLKTASNQSDQTEGFTNTFCPLQGASPKEEDPAPEMNDPAAYFGEQLHGMLNSHPQGNMRREDLQRNLDPQAAQALQL